MLNGERGAVGAGRRDNSSDVSDVTVVSATAPANSLCIARLPLFGRA